METIEKTVQINHVSVKVKSDFAKFIIAFESLPGSIDLDDLGKIAQAGKDIQQYIISKQGYQDLMIFSIADHGLMFRLIGMRRSAKQYLIGNPLYAFKMTQKDLRAALYAPLRILVYENAENETIVEYDLPSEQFGQFDNQEVREVALDLDAKIINLIAKADE